MSRTLLPMLAMAAAFGGGDFPMPPMRAPRARDRREPLDPHAECLRIIDLHGSQLRHVVTGEVRQATVWRDGTVWFHVGRRSFQRSCKAALPWLRNAVRAGGAS